MQADIDRLDREVADFTLTPLLDEVRVLYADQPAVLAYLEEVRQDILGNIPLFRLGEGAKGEVEESSLVDVPITKRYRANLFVDNSQLQGHRSSSSSDPRRCASLVSWSMTCAMA